MKRYDQAVLHGRIMQIRYWLRGPMAPEMRRELAKELTAKQRDWRKVKNAPVED